MLLLSLSLSVRFECLLWYRGFTLPRSDGRCRGGARFNLRPSSTDDLHRHWNFADAKDDVGDMLASLAPVNCLLRVAARIEVDPAS